MLVGGIKVEKDHAARVARFALEAVQAAHTVKLPGGVGSVKIRAGFHSGSVTSGVVGSEVPRYCLFGDTERFWANASPLLASSLHCTVLGSPSKCPCCIPEPTASALFSRTQKVPPVSQNPRALTPTPATATYTPK